MVFLFFPSGPLYPPAMESELYGYSCCRTQMSNLGSFSSQQRQLELWLAQLIALLAGAPGQQWA